MSNLYMRIYINSIPPFFPFKLTLCPPQLMTSLIIVVVYTDQSIYT